MMKNISLFICILLLASCSNKKVRTEAEAKRDREAIMETLNQHKAEFRECSARERDLVGKVLTQFTVGTDGRTSGAFVKSSDLNAPNVKACLLQVIRGIQFAPLRSSDSPLVFQFPFNYSQK